MRMFCEKWLLQRLSMDDPNCLPVSRAPFMSHKSKILIQSQRAFVGQFCLQDTLQQMQQDCRVSQCLLKVQEEESAILHNRGHTSSAPASRIAFKAITTNEDPIAHKMQLHVMGWHLCWLSWSVCLTNPFLAEVLADR